MTKSNTKSIIDGYAQSWTELNSKSDYLSSLVDTMDLSSQQRSYVLGYIRLFENQLESIEDSVLDYGDKYYSQMMKKVNTLSAIGVKLSPEFTQEVESKIKELNMNDFDFNIKEAVERFNLAYYSCSIVINSDGYVTALNGKHESNHDMTVLVSSDFDKFVTIEDVKNKIENLDLSF